jgi:hypothetical protein
VVNVFELVQYLFSTGYGAAITVEWFGQPDTEFLKSEVQFLNSCCRMDSCQPADRISNGRCVTNRSRFSARDLAAKFNLRAWIRSSAEFQRLTRES